MDGDTIKGVCSPVGVAVSNIDTIDVFINEEHANHKIM
jgi:hypothetical protein